MRKLRWFALAALALVPSLARADVPPPKGYVEGCTVEKQCKADEDGDACGTYHGERDKCQKLHATDGFVHKCNTRGASVWTEVWCRPKKAATKQPAPTTDDKNKTKK